jgi:UDP-N-acetylglucosamine:LPS N-acetylglucosamine transferase
MNMLRGWWNKYDRFWVTSGQVTKENLPNEKTYNGFFPENRNILNALRNTLLAIKVLKKEHPDVIFSTGAGIAPPFFLIGKLLGIKLIYLETASYIGIPTLSGKMIEKITDIFLVQHKDSKRFFPRAQYKGGLI